MQLIQLMIDFIIHINEYLKQIVETLGPGAYLVMFLVVFAETGLVVTPFLPGDSLLFAAGTLSAMTNTTTGQPFLNVWITCVVFMLAAFLGDNVNYWFGRTLGPKVMHENSRIFRKSYMDRTQEFFHKHGPRAVIMARFVPIVRTFAPFMAGVGHMGYGRYISFSLAGTVLWVGIFVTLGYFFGNIPAVQENFTVAILGIIAVSLLPGVWHWASAKWFSKPPGPTDVDATGDGADQE